MDTWRRAFLTGVGKQMQFPRVECVAVVSHGTRIEGIGEEIGDLSRDRHTWGKFPYATVRTLAFSLGYLQTQVLTASWKERTTHMVRLYRHAAV